MCTLLNMNLTSTTPRQIIPRLEDSVFRLGAAHPACTPNSESSISRSEGYFQGYAALPYFQQTRFNLFLFTFSNLRTYLIFMGQSSTSFNHIWGPSLYFIPFTPPTLGGGTYAIIGRRSHLKFCNCNFHTWILLRQNFGPQVRTRSGYHVRHVVNR